MRIKPGTQSEFENWLLECDPGDGMAMDQVQRRDIAKIVTTLGDLLDRGLSPVEADAKIQALWSGIYQSNLREVLMSLKRFRPRGHEFASWKEPQAFP